MGLFMYFASGKIFILIIVAAGFCLGTTVPIFEVSPVVWGLIPVLFCAILAGLGMQGLAWSGSADSKWIFVCVLVAGLLGAVTLILGLKYDYSFMQAATMYGLAVVLSGSIFFVTRAQARWHLLRWTFMCAGLGIDIILGARVIVDKIF